MSTFNLEKKIWSFTRVKKKKRGGVISSRTGYKRNHRNGATPGSPTTSRAWPLRWRSWDETSLSGRTLVPGCDGIFGMSYYLTVTGSQSKLTKEDAAGFLPSGPEFPWQSPVHVPVLTPPLDGHLVSHLCLPTTYCVSWCLLGISWVTIGGRGEKERWTEWFIQGGQHPGGSQACLTLGKEPECFLIRKV